MLLFQNLRRSYIIQKSDLIECLEMRITFCEHVLFAAYQIMTKIGYLEVLQVEGQNRLTQITL